MSGSNGGGVRAKSGAAQPTRCLARLGPGICNAIDPAAAAGLPTVRARLFHAADGALAGRFHFFDRERDDPLRSRLVPRPEDAPARAR